MMYSKEKALYLYSRLREGIATEDERTRFLLYIKTGCIEPKIVLEKLEKMYNDSKHN